MLYKPKYDKSSFEELVRKHFDFVEVDAGMTRGRVRSSGGNDPRDAGLVMRYSGDVFRFDVAWGEYGMSLTIPIKFGLEGLSNNERYVMFESFIEYLTGGKEEAIVPYLTENMSIKKIKEVMTRRQDVFRDGLPPVIEKVGKKLQTYLGLLQTVSIDQITGYQQWMNSKR